MPTTTRSSAPSQRSALEISSSARSLIAAQTSSRLARRDRSRAMTPLWRGIEALAWIAFFVFATLVLALRFWLLPDIERYRGDIVAAIERAVGLPIKIASIEAGWLGLRPQISLSDVHLYDHQG